MHAVIRTCLAVAVLAFPVFLAGSSAVASPAPLRSSAPTLAGSSPPPPTWTHVATSVSPPMDANLPMAYDPLLNETVLLVTNPLVCQSYTWVFNGTWSNISSSLSVSPPPRIYSGMTYDAKDGYLLLWGGYDPCIGGYLKDTWSFSNNTWTRIYPKVAPYPSASFGLTYDARDGYVVLYGGYNQSAPRGHTVNTQTWAYSAGNWTPLHPKSSPNQGEWPSLASVGGSSGYVLLFGGEHGRTLVGKTWEFYGGQWHAEHPSVSPSPRWAAGMVYDTAISKFVLFGGNTLNDTWTFANKTWTDITSTSGVAPPPNYWSSAFGQFSMTYDSQSGQVILFDGHNQTWTFG